ncbi:hypothetical protein Tco_1242227 [Tanacetum coccineum]
MSLRQIKWLHLNISTEESLCQNCRHQFQKRVSLAEILNYDPLNESLPTLSSSNTSYTQANKLPAIVFIRTLCYLCTISQRAVVCNTQPVVLPTSLPTSRDQVNPVAARRKRQTPLNDISNVLRTNVVCNMPTGVVGNYSLTTDVTPRQTKKVATTPSSVSLMQTPTSGNSIVSPNGILCNTINKVNRSILASNYLPSSGNPVTPVAAATHNLQSPLTDVSNVDLHTPMVGRATQCSKKASTTCVTTTIPGIQTRNSTYDVGESSRRPKRSKRPPLQSDTPVRFNLDEADGNVRKVYDKHIGISEGGKVDDSINSKGRGPYVFRLYGQTYHSMGSLLPKEGAPLKFAQFNSSSSSAPSKSKHHVDRDIIRQVKDVLDTLSDMVKTFRRARDRYSEDSEQNIRIKLVAKRGTDGRTNNLLTANEVVGLIVSDFNTCVEQRDIVIEKQCEGLERINIFHPLYLPLQYPFLMSCGQDGYHLEIPHRKKPR